jgi:hypothetical protein
MGHSVLCHRLMFELFRDEPITDDDLCCHTCDNQVGPCINPDHLFLGTQLDNMADMIAKGRARYAAILNDEKALEIKKLLLEDKLTPAEIGRMFGVSGGAIRSIKIGNSYRNVPWPTTEED